MKHLKRLLIAATLVLSLAGGSSQASADPGSPPARAQFFDAQTGVTWEDFGPELSAGITWE